jgi:hypothetical protein
MPDQSSSCDHNHDDDDDHDEASGERTATDEVRRETGAVPRG